jgi:uncharacterized protein (DUF1501 family)
MKRRQFIETLGVSIGAGASMVSMPTQAQSNDYRALVCVYLQGGNDGMNTIIPTNDVDPQRSYTKYSSLRGALTLPRGANGIAPLDGTNLGLHPRLAALAKIWQDGEMGVIHNVGPLVRPLGVDQLSHSRFREASWVPESLFSHSDQTYHWETGHTVSTTNTGWGGLAADKQAFNQVISFAGSTRFGSGAISKELVLPLLGADFNLRTAAPASQFASRRQALEQLLAQGSSPNLIQTALSNSQREALTLSSRLQPLLTRGPGAAGSSAAIDGAFGNLTGAYSGSLSKQLYQVAKCIETNGRAQLTGNRHIYYVKLTGFDNHGGQIAAHDILMKELGIALLSFHTAMKSIGMSNAVTTFTTSEFGRTLKPNKSLGTDHAWGGEHIVFGGAVKGKAEYGTYPVLELGGINDADREAASSQGRWLPTISVSQYASTLLRWLDPSIDIARVLPQLANFATSDIGFMKASS